jgi:translation initiation factor 3 subunit L
MLIYKELYYRHLHSKLQPVSLQDQIAAFENYSCLFEAIWENWPVELPGQWLWDIVDEYIYQMESFNRVLQKAKDDSSKSFVAAVKENPKVL